jgi:hypothetical protein
VCALMKCVVRSFNYIARNFWRYSRKQQLRCDHWWGLLLLCGSLFVIIGATYETASISGRPVKEARIIIPIVVENIAILDGDSQHEPVFSLSGISYKFHNCVIRSKPCRNRRFWIYEYTSVGDWRTLGRRSCPFVVRKLFLIGVFKRPKNRQNYIGGGLSEIIKGDHDAIFVRGAAVTTAESYSGHAEVASQLFPLLITYDVGLAGGCGGGDMGLPSRINSSCGDNKCQRRIAKDDPKSTFSPLYIFSMLCVTLIVGGTLLVRYGLNRSRDLFIIIGWIIVAITVVTLTIWSIDHLPVPKLPYISARLTCSRPIAFIVARKNVAAKVPRLSLLAIEASVSSSPCSFSRAANSA